MQEIKTVKISDKNYPESIKTLSDAPEVLYYRGVLPTPEEICVAVVGTRRASSYGEQVAYQKRRLPDFRISAHQTRYVAPIPRPQQDCGSIKLGRCGS